MLEKDENNIHVIVRLAAIYRKKGDIKQALRILNDAQKKDVLQDVINFEIAKVSYENGQYKDSAKQAIQLAEKVINLPEK